MTEEWLKRRRKNILAGQATADFRKEIDELNSLESAMRFISREPPARGTTQRAIFANFCNFITAYLLGEQNFPEDVSESEAIKYLDFVRRIKPHGEPSAEKLDRAENELVARVNAR